MRLPSPKSPVWAAVVLVLLVRLLVALSRLDDATFQFHTANIAVAVLEGLPLERVEIPLIPHNRGSMVAGWLAVPFVALLGNTLFAIKLEAILLAAATAYFFVRVLETSFGRAAAWTGAVLYALLPPAFQVLDVMPLGSHVDTVLLDFAALAWLLSWPRAGDPGRGPAFRLGLIAGVGLFFSFHFLVVVPALLAAWWAGSSRDTGAPRPRNLLAFAVGGVLGVSPAAFFLPDVGAATEVVNKPLADWLLGPGDALAKLVESVTTTWPMAWSFDTYGGAWARWMFGAAVLAGLAFAARDALRRNPGAVFLVGYPLLLLGAFSFTSFELNPEGTSGLGSRQISPGMPCLAAWVAVGVQRLLERGLRGAGVLLGAAAALAGAAGVLALVDVDVARGQPPVRGSDFSKFKRHIVRAAEGDPQRILDWHERLEPDWPGFRPLLIGDLPWEADSWADEEAFLGDVREAASRAPRLAPYYLVALGRGAARDDAVARAMGALAERATDAVGADATRYLLLGYGEGAAVRALESILRRRATDSRVGEPLLVFDHVASLPEPVGRTTARGMGFFFGEFASPYHNRVPGVVEQVARLPEPLREAFFVGAGQGYRTRFVEATYEVPTFLRIERALPPEHVDDFRRGLAWGESP